MNEAKITDYPVKNKNETTVKELAGLEVTQSFFRMKLSKAAYLIEKILEQTLKTEEETQDDLIAASEVNLILKF